MTQFLFITDLDNTLVGDAAALAELNKVLHHHRETYGTKLVYSTGRSLVSYKRLCSEAALLTPDALITGVGTAIYYETDGTPDPTWTTLLSTEWNRDRIVATSSGFPELTPQPDTEQGTFKVSYYLDEAIAADIILQLEEKLKAQRLQFSLIYSGGQDLDILPKNANKGLAMTFLRQQWQFDPSKTVVCGDSGNDRALFNVGNERGIIVGNARPELLEWHHANPSPYRYLAIAKCAGGILEGLNHFGFLPT